MQANIRRLGLLLIGCLALVSLVLGYWQVVAAPRLNPDELVEVAKEIGKRLQHTKGDAVMMLPLRGTSRYGVEGGPLRNPESDKTYYAAIKANLPKTIEVVEKDLGPEDPAFVKECCDRLIGLIEAKKK